MFRFINNIKKYFVFATKSQIHTLTENSFNKVFCKYLSDIKIFGINSKMLLYNHFRGRLYNIKSIISQLQVIFKVNLFSLCLLNEKCPRKHLYLKQGSSVL